LVDFNKSSWSFATLADKLEPVAKGLPRKIVTSGLNNMAYRGAVFKYDTHKDGNDVIEYDENFDLDEFKDWLRVKNIFRDTNLSTRPNLNAYLHYLDDNLYPHMTTAIRNDEYDPNRITGYKVEADYGYGAISRIEYQHYADAVKTGAANGNGITPASNTFTIEQYIDYLKYKLALGIGYDGLNASDTKIGLTLAEYKTWAQAKRYALVRGVATAPKINPTTEWYWPVSSATYYYGYDYVNGVFQQTAKSAKPTTGTFASGYTVIAGTGFIYSSGATKRIVDKSGKEVYSNAAAAREILRDQVWSYFEFLQLQSNTENEIGKEKSTLTAQLYADWVYDDLDMTLTEYILYLKGQSGLTQEDIAYLIAFGDSAGTLTKDRLGMSMAQYK
jgi:hypothetical protein